MSAYRLSLRMPNPISDHATPEPKNIATMAAPSASAPVTSTTISANAPTIRLNTPSTAKKLPMNRSPRLNRAEYARLTLIAWPRRRVPTCRHVKVPLHMVSSMSGENQERLQLRVQFWIFATATVLFCGLSLMSAFQGNTAGSIGVGLATLWVAWRASGFRKKLVTLDEASATARHMEAPRAVRTVEQVDELTGRAHIKLAILRLSLYAVIAMIASGFTILFALRENGWAVAAGGIAMLISAHLLRGASRELVEAGRQDGGA